MDLNRHWIMHQLLHACRVSVHEILHVYYYHAPNLFGSASSLRQGAFEISGSPSISAGVHALAFAVILYG